MRFNDARFQQDVQAVRPAGREIARQARAALERDGIDSSMRARCEGEHRDGTDLHGIVKLYLPIRYGEWGLVLQAAQDNAGLHLLVVAFGERHPENGPIGLPDRRPPTAQHLDSTKRSSNHRRLACGPGGVG